MPGFKSVKHFVIYWSVAVATVCLIAWLIPLLFELLGKQVAEGMSKMGNAQSKPSKSKSP